MPEHLTEQAFMDIVSDMFNATPPPEKRMYRINHPEMFTELVGTEVKLGDDDALWTIKGVNPRTGDMIVEKWKQS